MAARSKAWVYGRSLAEIVGSNPAGGMDVCVECRVLSGTGLCDWLIIRPEESYRLWCVVVCDLEDSKIRRPWPALGPGPRGGGRIRNEVEKQFTVLWLNIKGMYFCEPVAPNPTANGWRQRNRLSNNLTFGLFREILYLSLHLLI